METSIGIRRSIVEDEGILRRSMNSLPSIEIICTSLQVCRSPVKLSARGKCGSRESQRRRPFYCSKNARSLQHAMMHNRRGSAMSRRTIIRIDVG